MHQIVILKVPSKNGNEIDIWEWETNILETQLLMVLSPLTLSGRKEIADLLIKKLMHQQQEFKLSRGMRL